MRRTMVLLLAVLLTTGCVGPNKLKRTLDVNANKRYQERPVLHQLLLPYSLIMNHLAVLGDMLILNPAYWWRDVMRGKGTAYDYDTKEVVEPADE